MRLPLLACLLLLPLPSHAGQPISESLVECAAIFDMTNRMEPARLDTPKGAGLRRAAQALYDEAGVAAAAEGRTASGYLPQTYEAKRAKIDGRGLLWALSGEMRDWLHYCTSLADHRGLDLKAARDG